jgi:peptide-methionine (R)-S-oxide reductase
MKYFLVVTISFYFFCCGNMSGSNDQQITAGDSHQQKNPYYSRTDTNILNVPDETWKKILPDSIYLVARKKYTERAFTGKYNDFNGIGTYYCAVCGMHFLNPTANLQALAAGRAFSKH